MCLSDLTHFNRPRSKLYHFTACSSFAVPRRGCCSFGTGSLETTVQSNTAFRSGASRACKKDGSEAYIWTLQPFLSPPPPKASFSSCNLCAQLLLELAVAFYEVEKLRSQERIFIRVLKTQGGHLPPSLSAWGSRTQGPGELAAVTLDPDTRFLLTFFSFYLAHLNGIYLLIGLSRGGGFSGERFSSYSPGFKAIDNNPTKVRGVSFCGKFSTALQLNGTFIWLGISLRVSRSRLPPPLKGGPHLQPHFLDEKRVVITAAAKNLQSQRDKLVAKSTPGERNIPVRLGTWCKKNTEPPDLWAYFSIEERNLRTCGVVFPQLLPPPCPYFPWNL